MAMNTARVLAADAGHCHTGDHCNGFCMHLRMAI